MLSFTPSAGLKQRPFPIERQFASSFSTANGEANNGEANANKIINSSLTPALLKMRGIEATTLLAESPNSKVIVIGSGKDGLPLVLGGNN